MRRFYITQCLLVSILVQSCDQRIIQQEYENNPVHVFEALWWEFDQLYALFEVKQVNWDSLYAVYRPQVSKAMTDPALYDVLSSLLSNLNDNHILLYAEGMEVFQAGSLDQLPAYLSAQYATFESDINRLFYVVKNRHLQSGYKTLAGEIPCIYGRIDTDLTGASSIGYIYPGYGRDKDIDFIHNAFEALSETDGLIIDLRFSAGSNERLATEVAGRCTDQRRVFMTSRTRNGRAHDDFNEPTELYMRPIKPYYTNPIVLLTNRHTMDAAEELLLAMDLLPQVTILGDITAGAFSSVLTRDLPNGWRYTLPKSVVFANDGTCFEGIGLAPDVVVRNDRNELISSSKIDAPLSAAINHFK
ncbi:S41 family peptidase [Candidatus Neomarinimicrobiota bacterium]